MKYSYSKALSIFGFIILFNSCSEQKVRQDTYVFSKIDKNVSKIEFANNLVENDSLNYFTYAYIYMGGGVSAGDINNDGLADLYFTGNMVPNKLYLNKGNLQFEDISESAGVSGDDRWYNGTTMADVNNDGFLDIYCSVGGKFGPKENQLFINNGDNTFTEKAKSYGIDDPSNSVQTTFFDYDLDGDLDLYIANYPPTPFDAPNFYYAFKQKFQKPLETDRLFKNEDGKFVDVTEEAGLKTFGLSLSATVGDLNQDGWPDLYVSNDFSSPDYMFMNNRDGTFSEQVRKTTKNNSFYGMGVDIADFNNDMLLDIVQVDMTAQINRRAKANMASMNPDLFWSTVNAGFHYQYMQNTLQLNNGNLLDSLPDFSNISRFAGVSSTDWSWGPLFADLDNDGWKDLFISNGTRREINNRDFFLEIDKKGISKDSMLQKSLAIPSEKIDNYVLKNNGDLTFARKNKEWGIEYEGFSNGCVYVDLDNDGDLEIVVNNIDDYASVFENNSSTRNNHITIQFKGPEKNLYGLGTKVTLFSEGVSQFQELTLTRGFQSSVAPKLHFGLGKSEKVDSILVIWPDSKKELIKNPEVNSSLILDYSKATNQSDFYRETNEKLFQTATSEKEIVQHRHIENYYNDFEKEILLPHQTSMLGPNIAVGDLNNDGLDDIVVGSSSQNTTALYYQSKKNGFRKADAEWFALDSGSEDMGILIFDAENDGDNDIYIASGGNEFSSESEQLQDRLYLNDGNGNFSKTEHALPKMITSSSRVHAHDYDKDGDLDLFVGGRLVPGSYPSPTDSYILENKSEGTKVQFVNVTSKIAPMLEKIGMVTDAIWTDFDGDSWTDLILVGEWMPITVLKNDEGYFTDVTEMWIADDTSGWWFSIKEGDFDNDGDMDYLVGNLGKNFKYKASEEETFDVYFNDFDQNSTNDIVLSYYNYGEKFPVRGRECSSQQMPVIKKKFKNYESFSTATLEDVYAKEALDNSLHYQVKSFSSVYLENINGKLIAHTLPNLAQLSSINQIIIKDFDNDNNLDALIAGNLYNSEVETPRNDASNGLLLLGNGKGGFEPVPSRVSGFYAPGDVKDMSIIKINEKDYVVVAKNSDNLQFIENGTTLKAGPWMPNTSITEPSDD
ncbi:MULTISPECIES: VCBS repeat-containing protein [Flavobacteriaceae]|uniref:VCBS repeat-containing protein n=1 Tax=Flavobacteriaceae TaxID=49546 RepID=UPI001491AD52|nr:MULTISPECIES: VCBS repeat-containing protein [Allomuricauda]MDC6366792.1 VCBS repeat-containing protein [Muricauda sp. AC10]